MRLNLEYSCHTTTNFKHGTRLLLQLMTNACLDELGWLTLSKRCQTFHLLQNYYINNLAQVPHKS